LSSRTPRPWNSTPPRVRENCDIVISGNKIAKVGTGAAKDVAAEKTIDGTDKIVFPGIVCSHHHIYSALSRGIMSNIGPHSGLRLHPEKPLVAVGSGN
jgi:cytosine/adenosine deaminase-related metal-dependent hydrolase